jgi:NAD(P)-dependent dehydrogenase (short-subunit alcohol dehydrogenase family)
MKLEGKTALVTGAARGIGRGIAEVFAEQGADVAVNDIDITGCAADDLVRWIRAKGRRSMAVQADTSDRASVESMFKKVWDELGHIDILVNNAGIETIVPFLEITDEQWTRVTDVDLRGPWLCSQVFCRRVVAEGRKDSSWTDALRAGEARH